MQKPHKPTLNSANYTGMAPISKTKPKPPPTPPALDFPRQIAAQIKIPAVAIAGINATNVDEVLATGIKAIAVTAAIVASDDPQNSARRLKEKLKTSRSFRSPGTPGEGQGEGSSAEPKEKLIK